MQQSYTSFQQKHVQTTLPNIPLKLNQDQTEKLSYLLNNASQQSKDSEQLPILQIEFTAVSPPVSKRYQHC